MSGSNLSNSLQDRLAGSCLDIQRFKGIRFLDLLVRGNKQLFGQSQQDSDSADDSEVEVTEIDRSTGNKQFSLSKMNVKDCFIVNRVMVRAYQQDVLKNELAATTLLRRHGIYEWDPKTCPKFLRFVIDFYKKAYELKIPAFSACCAFPLFVAPVNRFDVEEFFRSELASFSQVEHDFLSIQMENHWGIQPKRDASECAGRRLNYGDIVLSLSLKLSRVLQPDD